MNKLTILALLAGLTLASCVPKPVSVFTLPVKKLVAPATITFSNNSENAESYEWDFGDGSSSDEITPTHRYLQSGNYEVTLKARKGNRIVQSKQIIQVMAPESCLVEIQTEFGNMLIELSNATPKHRDNFVKLAEKGFFDGTLFHRVMNNFMIQGGDPQSRGAEPGVRLGMGGPGYLVDAEFVDSLVHVKGVIAAARSGVNNPKKASNGSQFYIVHGTHVSDALLDQMETARGFHYTPEQRALYKKIGGYPSLDREYTVFGKVVKGLEVLDEIAGQQTDQYARPVKDVSMKVIAIK